MNFQAQIDLARKRIAFFTMLIKGVGNITSDDKTVDLVDYYNDHTSAECYDKLAKLKRELAEIYRDSQATSPFASPTQIEITRSGIRVQAFILRVEEPRLVLCQDRVMQIDDMGIIVKELDLLEYFRPSSNIGETTL